VYNFLVRLQDAGWVGLLERRRGLLGRLFRLPQTRVDLDAVVLVDSMLSSTQLISDVRWHYDDSEDPSELGAAPRDLTRLS
jgi:hypothetical protein